jgi:hypothetical protein
LQAGEVHESAVVGAIEGVDADLHAVELLGDGAVDVCERSVDVAELGSVFHVVGVGGLPEFGLDAAEPAEEPVGIDEGVDQGALLGGSGLEAVEVLLHKVVQVGVALVEDDEGSGMHAGFEGIHAGGGFAGRGAGAGGALRIAAIRFGLFR